MLRRHEAKGGIWQPVTGNVDPGENLVTCARREVEEETGLRCLLEDELRATRYRDSRGRPKVVRWWRMSVDRGEFEPNREVDEIRWLRPDAAAALLSYERDLPLLDVLRG
ncbi:MAG: NUDIX domain-containing protein [Actinomycetota bacterium]|nr:NUDIX domain-containing protein [Actinomycetota bacterium]